MQKDIVFYKSSLNMSEIADLSVDLIITSPPYYNIKDYSKDGYQTTRHSKPFNLANHVNYNIMGGSDYSSLKSSLHKYNKTFTANTLIEFDSTNNNNIDLGSLDDYSVYIITLLKVWKECERALKPNGKLCINVPLMPMLKKDLNTHYNRHIFDLQSDIQQSILKHTKLFLMDLYIWNRTNPTKKLMFGSYPYPRNFYAQNTCEFIAVFVKDGKAQNNITQEIKDKSKLSQNEWVEFTKQIWDIPIPNKSDLAFGKHSSIMPEQIPYRLIKLFSFVGDVILDPFAGSGTTLKVAKELKRHFIGYEIYEAYKDIIESKLRSANVD